MGYFDDEYEEQEEGLDQEVDLDEEETDEEEEDEDTIQELEVDERGRPRIRRDDYYDGDLD